MRNSAPSTGLPVPSRRAALRRLLVAAGVPQGFGAAGALAAPTAGSSAPVVRRRPRPVLPDAVRARLIGSGLPLESFGIHAMPLDGDAPVLSLHADEPFVLASTAKIVTALAALDLLGPRYRWRTRAYLAGALAAGRLNGDLLIVGGGDVQLTTDDLRRWFARMHEAGLQDIRGNILLDRTAFRLGDADYATTPVPSPDRPHHVRPDGLTLEGGVVRVAVQPGRGGHAAVSLTPPLADVRLVNGVAMGQGCSASAFYRAAQRGAPELQISGNWSAACGTREIEFAPLPADELTLRAIGELWRESGGRLLGRVVDHVARRGDSPLPLGPDGEVLPVWQVHGSPPLVDLVHAMNKTSQNVAARHLMLSLSPGFPRRPATLSGAQARLRQWLMDKGLAADDIVIDNGSGLSRAERGRPAAMVKLLRTAWQAPTGQAFFDSLPVAGVDGTLAHRLTQSAVQGQAHLKTGTLLDTRALAGYVHGRNRRWYAVAVLANHPQAALATPALDGVIDWLVRQG